MVTRIFFCSPRGLLAPSLVRWSVTKSNPITGSVWTPITLLPLTKLRYSSFKISYRLDSSAIRARAAIELASSSSPRPTKYHLIFNYCPRFNVPTAAVPPNRQPLRSLDTTPATCFIASLVRPMPPSPQPHALPVASSNGAGFVSGA